MARGHAQLVLVGRPHPCPLPEGEGVTVRDLGKNQALLRRGFFSDSSSSDAALRLVRFGVESSSSSSGLVAQVEAGVSARVLMPVFSSISQRGCMAASGLR